MWEYLTAIGTISIVVPLDPIPNAIWNLSMIYLLFQAYRLGLKVKEYLIAVVIISITIMLFGFGSGESANNPILAFIIIISAVAIGTFFLMMLVKNAESKEFGFGQLGRLRRSKNVEETYRKNLYINNQFKIWVRSKQNPFDLNKDDRDHEFEKLYAMGELERCRRRLNEMGIEGVDRSSGIYTAFSQYATELARFDRAVMKSYKGKKIYGIEDDPAGAKIDKWAKRD